MRILHSVLFFFCLVFLGSLSDAAHADIINTFAKVDCSERLNYLRIDVFNVNGDLTLNRAKKDGKTIREQENTVFFDDLIEVDDDYYQRQKDKFVTLCTLQEEVARTHDEDVTYKTVTYTVMIEPHIFNSNRQGKCGGAESFSVTIKDKDRVLVDDVPFWFNCNKMVSSDIEDQDIHTLIFTPHEGFISFWGRYTSPIAPATYKNIIRNFKINRSIPITIEKLYKAEE